jgi:hypothetical protein
MIRTPIEGSNPPQSQSPTTLTLANLHTFVPLPSTPSHSTMLTHGGLPTHMIIVNPEPHFRPTSARPSEPSAPVNAVRSRSSPGESSNLVHLPIHSATSGAPTSSAPAAPPSNPEQTRHHQQLLERNHLPILLGNQITNRLQDEFSISPIMEDDRNTPQANPRILQSPLAMVEEYSDKGQKEKRSLASFLPHVNLSTLMLASVSRLSSL